MAEGEPVLRSIAQNRKARHSYEILEELECGVVLKGTEVKSLRAGRCSLEGSWVRAAGEELFLVGCHVPEYSHGNVHNHEPLRERKLLAHRREILRLGKAMREKGVTAVPLGVYFKDSRVKVRIALVRGKRQHDKRESLRERSAKRDIERATARRR